MLLTFDFEHATSWGSDDVPSRPNLLRKTQGISFPEVSCLNQESSDRPSGFDFAPAASLEPDDDSDYPAPLQKARALSFPESSWLDQEDSDQLRGVIHDNDQIDLNLRFPDVPLDVATFNPHVKRIHSSWQASELWPTQPIFAHSSPVSIPDIHSGLRKRAVSLDLVKLEHFLVQNISLMYYQDSLCHFDQVYWRKLSPHRSAVLFKTVLQEFELADCLTDSDYRKLIKMVSENPEIQQDHEIFPPSNAINFQDGTLNLLTGQLEPHDPKDGFFRVVDFNYCDICFDRQTDSVFEAFIAQVSDGDREVRQQVLELIALLLSETNLKQFYVLLGPSNTGKSQIGKFLEALVGAEHVTTIRGMSDFSSQWTTGSMQGKRLASCLDLPDEPLQRDAAGIIKQLVGDDTIKVEEKYKSPSTMRKKPLLFLAGNYPLRGKTLDDAILNRMVIIPFTNPCPPDEMKQELFLDFWGEAPYIIGQAICAFQALEKRNFQVTRAAVPEAYLPQTTDSKTQFLDRFVRCCCAFQESAETTTRDLYHAFCRFSECESFPVMSEIDFSRQWNDLIRSVSLPIMAVKRVNGSEARGYRGIALCPTPAPAFPQAYSGSSFAYHHDSTREF